MASEALRMVIRLEIDESLRTNFAKYQQQQSKESQPEISQKRTECKFPSQIKMFPWNDIHQISQHIYCQTRFVLCICQILALTHTQSKNIEIPTESQRLFFRGKEITKKYNKKNRKNKKLSSPTLSSCGIVHDSIIYLQCDSASFDIAPIVLYGSMNKLSDSEKHLIAECKNGIYDDMKPILSEDGEGGTYFLRDSNNTKIACFKPSDEEAGAINNPRGRCDPQQAMHCGIKPTEGHLREIAAYLIDSDHFHAVPPTIRVEIAYRNGFHYNANHQIDTEKQIKVGALQKFIKGEVVENFAEQNFAIREVHKIGILDIRILNCDRNSGNVLVSRDEYGRYELNPIDHGLSLPEKIEITRDSWVWLNWKQSKQPFDPYTIDFINKIDIEEDIKKLKSSLNFKQIIFENMRISHLVLKKCAQNGLTLHDIGSIIARPDFDTKSILEELMVQAESLGLEKIRQNKHLNTRFKVKRSSGSSSKYSSNTPKFGAIKSEQVKSKKKPTHIFQKIAEQHKAPPAVNGGMVYVPSLAPSSSSNGKLPPQPKSQNYQILNRNKSDTESSMSGSSQLAFSPNPRLFACASSTLSVTPEPFMLYNSFKPPKAIIVHKKQDEDEREKEEKSQQQIEVPFWTPNYRATSITSVLSSRSQQASNPNVFRSVTPDQTQREKQSYGSGDQQRNYNNNRTNRNTDIPEIFLTTPPQNVKNAENINIANGANLKLADDHPGLDEDCEDAMYSLHSPIELEYHQSIHDRFENGKVSNKHPVSNTILKRISMPSSEISGSESEVSEQNLDADDVDKNLYKLQHGIQESVDNYDETHIIKNGCKVQSFSSLKLGAMPPPTLKQPNISKEKELIPLSRSTSCIDVRKRSLSQIGSLEPITSAQKSIDTQGMSDDFLYRRGSSDLKSASLINHSSMTKTRNEMLSLSMLNSHSPSLVSECKHG